MSTSLRACLRFVLACSLLGLGGAIVSACDGEDPECAKDSDCQAIDCPDGTTLQTCDDGTCLAGDDCKQEADGGW